MCEWAWGREGEVEGWVNGRVREWMMHLADGVSNEVYESEDNEKPAADVLQVGDGHALARGRREQAHEEVEERLRCLLTHTNQAR